jgi:hypothetical protein
VRRVQEALQREGGIVDAAYDAESALFADGGS